MKTQTRPREKRSNEESNTQKSCVTWFRLQYPKKRKLLIAIPNGAVLRGDAKQRAIQMNRMKAEGLVPGAADLFLSIPSGDLAGLYIEMKTKKSAQSKEQKIFEVEAVQAGYGYVLARSLDQFMSIVKRYLEHGDY